MGIHWNDQVEMDKTTRARMRQSDSEEITDGKLFLIIFILGMLVGGVIASGLHDKLIHVEQHYENQSNP